MELCRTIDDRCERAQNGRPAGHAQMRWVGTMALVGALVFASSAQAGTTCTEAEQQRAVNSMEQARHSWNGLFAHQQVYGHCDDGELAEGYSDAVVHLLAQSKAPWPELQQQVRRSPSFAVWVVRHVDATASTVYLEQVVRMTAICGRAATEDTLCARVHRAARAAVAESTAAGASR